MAEDDPNSSSISLTSSRGRSTDDSPPRGSASRTCSRRPSLRPRPRPPRRRRRLAGRSLPSAPSSPRSRLSAFSPNSTSPNSASRASTSRYSSRDSEPPPRSRSPKSSSSSYATRGLSSRGSGSRTPGGGQPNASATGSRDDFGGTIDEADSLFRRQFNSEFVRQRCPTGLRLLRRRRPGRRRMRGWCRRSRTRRRWRRRFRRIDAQLRS